MRISSYFSLAAGLVLAALSCPLFAKADSDWSTDHLDDAWAERALAHPELDEGWCQPCHNDSDHRIGARILLSARPKADRDRRWAKQWDDRDGLSALAKRGDDSAASTRPAARLK